MENLIKIGNNFYDLGGEHFALKFDNSFKEVEHLFSLRQIKRLVSANFSSSDLNDNGLLILSNFIELDNLNIQDTQITNEGIKYLKKLKNLKFLRLKENPQLTNECIFNLIEIESLQDLQIQETSITEEGLKNLLILKNLRNITLDVSGNNYTFEGLLQLSIDIPDCNILAKGGGVFQNGKFEGIWNY